MFDDKAHRIIDTDVLVVGGGLGGCMAAIKAAEPIQSINGSRANSPPISVSADAPAARHSPPTIRQITSQCHLNRENRLYFTGAIASFRYITLWDFMGDTISQHILYPNLTQLSIRVCFHLLLRS